MERQGTLGIARLWVGDAASPEVWKRVASRARENAYVFLPRVMEVVNPHRVRTGTGLVKQK